jgi:hypothetical protein
MVDISFVLGVRNTTEMQNEYVDGQRIRYNLEGRPWGVTIRIPSVMLSTSM